MQLARSISHGDQAAFAHLVDRYHPGLVRLAMTFVPHQGFAVEVVKNTWMDMLESLDQFDGYSSFKTWLYKMLHARLAQTPDSLMTSGTYQNLHHDRASSPEPLTVSEEVNYQFFVFHQILSVMTPIQRQVVILRDLEQFTKQEVCEILGISSITYLIQLHLSRNKLFEILHENCGDHKPIVD